MDEKTNNSAQSRLCHDKENCGSQVGLLGPQISHDSASSQFPATYVALCLSTRKATRILSQIFRAIGEQAPAQDPGEEE